ncbi:MAG TPA: monovalent cation/H(+) antiporter subunit G [Hyphomonadaceae bacterium]|nr:monovalent cation/H(+) antiporter subunit G [Hyphomonadaceae bacterium]
MPEWQLWTGGGLAAAGALLAIVGAAGVLRFPDVYTRIHAASITDTGGSGLIILGLCFLAGLTPLTLKLLLVWVFVILATPAAANALANAAFGSGHSPWSRGRVAREGNKGEKP